MNQAIGYNRNRHRQMRTVVLISIALVLGLLLLLRSGYVQFPFWIVFPLILTLAVSPTLVWWTWADEWASWRARPAKVQKDKCGSSGWTLVLRVALGIYAIIVLMPLVLLMAGSRVHDALPTAAITWLMVWYLAVLLVTLIALMVWLTWVAASRLTPLTQVAETARRKEDGLAAPPESAEVYQVQMSRRAMLSGALACSPVVLSGGATLAGLRQEGRFAVRRVSLQLDRLPERLRGLTITHLSDLHVGRLFRPEHLDAVLEATGRLDSDIIAITGDIVDHSADYLPAACDAFAQMYSRYGRYMVIGNHDLIDSPRHAVEYLAAREPNFLIDQTAMLEIGGEPLRIAGLFWSRHEEERFGTPGHRQRTQAVMADADPDMFTLGLVHHPHAFDAMADAGVDLTLAGHTHGGQMMFTPPGSALAIGGGNLLFRYIHGEYRRNNSALYVSSGVGNWFPVRINAPAEIVQIQLV